MDAGRLDYRCVLAQAGERSGETLITFLIEELPHVWCEAYKEMSPRQTNIMRVRHNAFSYIYDAYTWLEAAGDVPQGMSV